MKTRKYSISKTIDKLSIQYSTDNFKLMPNELAEIGYLNINHHDRRKLIEKLKLERNDLLDLCETKDINEYSGRPITCYGDIKEQGNSINPDDICMNCKKAWELHLQIMVQAKKNSGVKNRLNFLINEYHEINNFISRNAFEHGSEHTISLPNANH